MTEKTSNDELVKLVPERDHLSTFRDSLNPNYTGPPYQAFWSREDVLAAIDMHGGELSSEIPGHGIIIRDPVGVIHVETVK